MSKKILIFGNVPLPEENPEQISCPEIRTGIFINYLKKTNTIRLIGIRRTKKIKGEQVPDIYIRPGFDFEYFSIYEKVFLDLNNFRNIAYDFNPDIMIGINSFPSYYAASTGLSIPFWADLNGSMMCEVQLKAAQEKNEELVKKFWNIERTIIQRADKFSTVSNAQKFELIGELAGIERLNKYNSGYEFIEIIPEPLLYTGIEKKNEINREVFFDKDDFVLLWTGGYNYWTDVNFLFEGITKAMERNPKIKFISIGGDIPGQKTKKYKKLKKMISESKYKDSFIFPGWVRTEDVNSYYSLADYGINIDIYSYETQTGTRYRIVDMLRNGLPVLTSLGTEISDIIKQESLGAIFTIEDINDFSDKILNISKKQKSEIFELKKKCSDFAEKEFNPKKLLTSLNNWVNNPDTSPDHNIITGFKQEEIKWKKLWTLMRLMNNPVEFYRTLKRKFKAFLNG